MLVNSEVCVMFNFYQNSDLEVFLHNFLSAYFSEIILMIPAPTNSTINQVLIDKNTSITYFHCDNPNGGFQGYYCLGQLMKYHNSSSIVGYLHVNDDVALKYSSLLEMNLQDIWFPIDGAGYNLSLSSLSSFNASSNVWPDTWHWW